MSARARDGEPEGHAPAAAAAEDSDDEARWRAMLAEQDREYQRLLRDALGVHGAMRGPFGVPSAGEWRETCARAGRDYRSGRFLIERLGAERYLTPDLTATLWRLRRGLAEETGARSTAELMLVDLAVLAYADALRVQGWLGNWMLVAEGEAFGQEGLRARFRERYGGGSGEIRGLWLEEHVGRLREQLVPLLERFQRLAGEHLGALRAMRGEPSGAVERSRPIDVRIVPG